MDVLGPLASFNVGQQCSLGRGGLVSSLARQRPSSWPGQSRAMVGLPDARSTGMKYLGLSFLAPFNPVTIGKGLVRSGTQGQRLRCDARCTWPRDMQSNGLRPTTAEGTCAFLKGWRTFLMKPSPELDFSLCTFFFHLPSPRSFPSPISNQHPQHSPASARRSPVSSIRLNSCHAAGIQVGVRPRAPAPVLCVVLGLGTAQDNHRQPVDGTASHLEAIDGHHAKRRQLCPIVSPFSHPTKSCL